MAVLFIIYVLVGIALACLADGSNFRGRAVTVFIWPWALWADGTPHIRWLTHFSGKELVIEETTLPDMTIVQTVRQRAGHEYTRVKGE